MEFPYLPQANCAGTDPEAFFPRQAISSETQAAMRVCANCVEREPCAAWAVEHELHGIWGGTTPNDRKRIRQEMGLAYSAPEVSILRKIQFDEQSE